jgi:type II secretory pathway component PulK
MSHGAKAKQQGVALAIVVWFIAGMSLLVASIVSQATVDTRLAQLHVAKAEAAAAGDGAIQLMLAQRMFDPTSAGGQSANLEREFRLGSTDVSVSLQPAASFIDLNSAPQPVLAGLFLVIGQVDESEANSLATNVVQWRSTLPDQDSKLIRAPQFHTIEDLLRIDGMSRTLFDAVRNYIVVGKGTPTDWALAPPELLAVLNQASPGEIDAINKRRDQLGNAANVSTTGNPPQGGGSSLSGMYRADAKVAYGDQIWLRRRWVSIGSLPGSKLPWYFERTEPLRIYQPYGVR